MKYLSKLIVIFLLSITACNRPGDNTTYQVHRITEAPEINAVWDKPPWSGIKPLQLQNYMGDRPEHFPFTQAKVAYDNAAVYIIFRVEDRYVKAVTRKNHGPVFTDSCVEFFFSPADNSQKGYFNLEMNCGGTMLFHHQLAPGIKRDSVSEGDIAQIEVAHSLPKIVDPEIEEDTTWIVEYRIPFSVISHYQTFPQPGTGTIWRANFYKCADKTSHPHWLTWAPIDQPRPDFHQPGYFGTLEFR